MAQDPSNRPSLPLEIKAATREQHTALNRLIIARLPLCLPPHAHSPNLYAIGVELFGQIYAAIEHPWDESIQLANESAGRKVIPASQTNRLRLLRTQLLLPGLVRRYKLRHDLDLLARITDLELDVFGHTSTLEYDWPSQIGETLITKPHLILAYAWVMYMALFNGGRWMKSQFRAHKTDFWKAAGVDCQYHGHECQNCLSFWDFAGERDGEDIKEEFVAKFHELAPQLTDQERQEVVEEAANIFHMCIDLVESLDQQVAEMARMEVSSPSPARSRPRQPSQPSLLSRMVDTPAHWSELWRRLTMQWGLHTTEPAT